MDTIQTATEPKDQSAKKQQLIQELTELGFNKMAVREVIHFSVYYV